MTNVRRISSHQHADSEVVGCAGPSLSTDLCDAWDVVAYGEIVLQCVCVA